MHKLLALSLTALTLNFAACGDASVQQGPLPMPGEPARSGLSRELAPELSPGELEELVTGNTAFAADLYKQLEPDDKGNLFMSPSSISIALAMTYAGAAGDTEAQMAEVLHFTLPSDRLHGAFNRLDLELSSRGEGLDAAAKPFRLHTINQLWGQAGFPFETDYLDLIARNYGAGLQLLDFQTRPEPSRGAINDWVASTTEDRIQDLLPPDSIDSDTRLVLTNAIYFNAAWASEFDKKETRDGRFTTASGSVVTVPMMHKEEQLRYGAGEGYVTVELPYEGNELSMIAVLPDDMEGFEATMHGTTLGEIVAEGEPALVGLTMPRFEFTSNFTLAPQLVALGMVDAFTPQADFSRISSEPLMVSQVYHKAFVSVNEEETEAAAATAVVMGDTSAGPPGEVIRVTLDRPFLFLIVDRSTGTILFIGRVANPSP